MTLGIGNIKRPCGLRKKSKRVGRGIGSGKGKTTGRGHKGAKARSGGGDYNPGYEGGQMPLVRRVPKRGFTNKFKIRWNVINVGDLEAYNSVKKGTLVDKEFLIKNKYLKRKRLPLKVLGKGKLSKAITVKADSFSKNAAKIIEEAGGKAEVI